MDNIDQDATLHSLDSVILTMEHFSEISRRLDQYFDDEDFSKKNITAIAIMVLAINAIFASGTHLENKQKTNGLFCDLIKEIEKYIDLHGSGLETLAHEISNLVNRKEGLNE